MQKKILIVEDDPDIVEILQLNLPQHGFKTHAVFDGETGLAEALSSQYDLAIIDLMLPKLDGLEVCRKLKRTKQEPASYYSYCSCL